MKSTQKLAVWVLGFLIFATIGAYGVMKYVQESMDAKRYKGMDLTMTSLEKLKQMQEQGAPDFKFQVIEPFGKTGLESSGPDAPQSKPEDVAMAAPVSLAQFKGKVILLNFWASWCEPCIKEFPDLIALVNKVPEVVIVAISRDAKQTDAESFIRAFPESKGKILFGWDPDGSITQMYGTEVLPESIIIKKDFRVDKKISGIEAWGADHIVDYFKFLASDPVTGATL